ncbi:TPA: glycerophosphodiester phosphodiesterase [Streptococcus suis]|uniref:glycerophosphodiester phosphodiesterase n=1 Tax=Streptococcus parasuis TaxID=1501662 RepID=UPI0023780FB0|nr:glycerophosphodiester phosphodiesterase [Streptococcus parasuis]WDN58359.1 glycerophosphodiester phosphodiesterase [Streptococcus parasuis]WDN60175.1 glycerophosphodiester phosphodiesterase [Streptococcus parasuis]
MLYSIQLFIEGYAPSLSYWLAVVCYIVLRLTYYGVIALFMIGFISLLTGKKLPIYCRKRLRHRLRLAILNGNAVQNSIEALEKTSQLKPDYIEMDVQETKDGQFIVMHDTDLMALTGNTGGTHDYTLAELTAMTASENGMTGPVPSFHEYLEKADELGQKLLVEIKVTDADSPNLTRNFLKKYGQRLIAKGHQMHSLDYRTIIESKQYNEQLVSFFILPFNSIYPTTVADGYTIEYTSLDQNFMTKSWIRGKSVYAWTPNDKESMTKMLLVQVDGIITDNLTGLKSLMSELKENHRYPDLFFLEFQHFFYNFE